jgi:hypothetical protein
MTRAIFRQSDVTRAIRAARAAGFTKPRCEIWPDGRIVVEEQDASNDDPYSAWKANREGASKGRP